MRGDIHVTPVDDLCEHEFFATCVCLPRTEPVVQDDGSIGWIVIHHSLDGREATE